MGRVSPSLEEMSFVHAVDRYGNVNEYILGILK